MCWSSNIFSIFLFLSIPHFPSLSLPLSFSLFLFLIIFSLFPSLSLHSVIIITLLSIICNSCFLVLFAPLCTVCVLPHVKLLLKVFSLLIFTHAHAHRHTPSLSFSPSLSHSHLSSLLALRSMYETLGLSTGLRSFALILLTVVHCPLCHSTQPFSPSFSPPFSSPIPLSLGILGCQCRALKYFNQGPRPISKLITKAAAVGASTGCSTGCFVCLPCY